MMEHKHHRCKFRRHRRTASTGSNNLPNSFSSDPAQSLDTATPAAAPSSSTLPLSVAKQQIQKALMRPGSADSTRYEAHTPPGPHPPAPQSKPPSDRMIGLYAKGVAENIEMLTIQSNEECSGGKEKGGGGASGGGGGGGEKGWKGETSTKFRLLPRFNFRGQAKQANGAKPSSKEKPATKANNKSTDSNSSDGVSSESKSSNQSDLAHFPLEEASLQLSGKPAVGDIPTSGASAAQVSRMPSMASSVDRSDSFASTASTTFSGVGGESSPYSTLSSDSFLIQDSIGNLQQLPFTPSYDILSNRGPFFTPIAHPSYPTSSSDEENRSYPQRQRTSTAAAAGQTSHLFQPLSLPSHHHAHSSCDSDQLQSHSELQISPGASYAGGEVPLCHTESICLSDMERYTTDQEEMQEKIDNLEKKMGKVRRSSTGSITIFNSGSSMEDIRGWVSMCVCI